MKTHSKPIFNIFTLLTLLAMLFSISPTSLVQAESLASPLYANGDFVWAKSIGGTTTDIANGIAVDSSGNVYTTGFFSGTADFDPGVGTADLTSAGSNDIFISKLDGSGNFVWAKSLGGTSSDVADGIAVDSNGNVYTTGYFSGTADFDPGAGIFNLISAGLDDIFVSKLDSSGNFVWAKNMGGAGFDYSKGIAIDSSSNVYTTGYFSYFTGSADFDPGVGTYNLTYAGSNDIFVSKLDSSGNFIWAKSTDGTGDDRGLGIAVDPGSNVYTTGSFTGTADFDPGVDISNLVSAGSSDIFVSKLNSSGSFVWAKNMGGSSGDGSNGIAVDSSGNVYTTGSFGDYLVGGTADFDPGVGTFNLTSAGDSDIFVSKLDSNGNFVWAKSMSGTNIDGGLAIIVDSSGNVYTTGMFQLTVDFDPGAGTFNIVGAGDSDIFISKLDSSGNFVWAKSMSGTAFDNGRGIALDSSGNVYTTGRFFGTGDFDPGAGTANLTSAGDYDIFVSKLERDSVAPTVKSITRASGSANPTNLASLDFTVTFSESVTGVNVSDFSLTTSVSGATISGVGSSGITYTVTVNTGTGNGAIRLDVVDDDTIKDGALNPLGAGFTSGEIYTIIKSATFTDVPLDYWASSFIERLYNAGITGGCSLAPLSYCPDSTVTRAQMAIFLLRGMHGSSYTPPAVGASTGFTDVATDYWAAAWIKQLAAEGITGGCGTGIYCPDATVTRAQMAIFLLKAKHGSSYSPPAATGVFTDVPVGYWADKWIEQLAVEGITGGCGVGVYCPDSSVTRAQMAVFLVKTFNLP